MYSIDQLEEEMKGRADDGKMLPRSKRAVVKLGQKTNYIDICVISNILIGLVGAHKTSSKMDKPFRLRKLQAHIEEIKNNPNAKVFLGGDLFYFPGGTPSYREEYSPSYTDQINLLVELLEPIKNRIVCAYDGTEETKIFEKDGLNLTRTLMQRLGLLNRYMGQMAEVDFVFRNEYTAFTPKVVNMVFDHGFLVANTMPTIARKTEGVQDKIVGKDFYFTSHYNRLFIEKTAVLTPDKTAHMIKRPCYFVSVGGYRDYPNRLTSNRNVSPANTNNGMFRVFVAPNPDRNNIRGNNYLGEPAYKVCLEFVNFGRSETLGFDFDLIEQIASLNESNIINRDALIARILEKVEQINKQNAQLLIERYYGEVISEREDDTPIVRRTQKQKKPVLIKEEDEDERSK